MKKVLIIGSHGMAGHVIYNYLKAHTTCKISDIARQSEPFVPTYQLQIKDFTAIEEILLADRPDVVINCIGILNQDAEENPDKAILLNSYLPHYLAACGKRQGFRVIHISTDCVFNGKIGGYRESSPKDGEGFYAQTKALGEIEYGENLTIRTSIIGPELKTNGIGLFHWFMQQKGKVKGFREVFWSGVTTLQLAKAVAEFIENDEPKGLIHLTNNEKINKLELLELLNRVFKKNSLSILPYDAYKIDKSLISSRSDFKANVPSYADMISELYRWMKEKKALYGQYGEF